MTTARVTPLGFSVGGAQAGWGAYAGERDPLAACAAALVGARNLRLPRLDRSMLAALVVADLVLAGSEPPAVLVVEVEDGSAARDRAYWATARGRGGADASPTLFAATLPSAVAGEIAMTFGLRGPCVVLAGTADPDVPPGAGAARADPGRGRRCLRVRLLGWDSADGGEASATLD